LLREYQPTDVASLYEAVIESKEDLAKWLPWCQPNYGIEDSRSWVESRALAFSSGTEYAFAIARPDGRFLGGCGLNQIDPNHRRANLGYWVRSSETGKGIATEAVRLLADWAFRKTDLIRLEIVAAAGNVPSQRVAERRGPPGRDRAKPPPPSRQGS
jgi:RimJ/RimL family protein N-acetyltransferase